MVPQPTGRLTLESGVPVSTTDQVDKTTLYYTPYMGNLIPLYNGTYWEILTFSELPLNISAFTASKPYDIFAYNNSGTVTLEGLVWTNATTRATALAYQDGRLVKSGATTRLYLGTIYMDSASKCQDKKAQRFVWNYYNRINRDILAQDTTDAWTYTTATWRAANNSTVSGVARIELITGVAEENTNCAYYATARNDQTGGGRNFYAGVGLDVTNANSATIKIKGCTAIANGDIQSVSILNQILSVGYHYLQATEYADASGTTTWNGDAGAVANTQTGMIGTIRG
jgi:hypothetical protein